MHHKSLPDLVMICEQDLKTKFWHDILGITVRCGAAAANRLCPNACVNSLMCCSCVGQVLCFQVT